jgi:hypothetical protein
MNARRPARACGLVLPLLLAGGWASGCGDSPAERPVRLEITAPIDAAVVRGGRVGGSFNRRARACSSSAGPPVLLGVSSARWSLSGWDRT